MAFCHIHQENEISICSWFSCIPHHIYLCVVAFFSTRLTSRYLIEMPIDLTNK